MYVFNNKQNKTIQQINIYFFIFKVMLAFNREILLLTRNMVMLNWLNWLNLSEYKTMNVTRNLLLKKLRWYQLENFTTLAGIKDQNNRKVFTRISSTALRYIFSCRNNRNFDCYNQNFF